MSIRIQTNIEQELWQDVYIKLLSHCDQSKDARIIKSYGKMCAEHADTAIYEFRARSGHHSQVVPVVQGSPDSALYDEHGNSLINNYIANE